MKDANKYSTGSYNMHQSANQLSPQTQICFFPVFTVDDSLQGYFNLFLWFICTVLNAGSALSKLHRIKQR